MPKRILEVHTTHWPPGAIERIAQAHDLLEVREGAGAIPGSARILVDADAAPAVIDELTSALAGDAMFRILLIPVEAVIPVAQASTVEQPSPPVTGSVSVDEVRQDVVDLLGHPRVFFVLSTLSAVVVAAGLTRDSAALVIGGMVIAPLLGPSVALGLATTLADTALAQRAAFLGALGLLLVLTLSVGLGLVIGLDFSSGQIADRTVVRGTDIIVALAAGAAAALSMTTGVPVALVGVMVAVALLPPTVVLGLAVGAAEANAARGAAVLLAVNLIAVNLAAVATFALRGARTRYYWDEARAGRATKRAIVAWLTLLAALGGIVAWIDPPL